MTTVLRGHVVHLTGTPHLACAAGALREHPDGFLAFDDDGIIVGCDAFENLPADLGDVPVDDLRGRFILPGFVDTHVHFPQVYCADAWGGGPLLSWLERRVFPAEARLSDARFAAAAARDFCDALLRSGTTCALIFGSQFEAAQDALFAELEARGLRAIVGRTTMVAGPESAAALLTDEDEAVRRCRAEIARWHPAPADMERALRHVAVIPRYALSMTPRGLRLLGQLYSEVRELGVRFSTHLAEDDRPSGGELAAVRSAFGVTRSLDVYDDPGFLGPLSVMAHAVHCDDREVERLTATGTSVAHCPVSQLFLGNPTMPLRRLLDAGVGVGIGSDIGAGDTFSVPEVLNAAYKVHAGAREPVVLGPASLLHLGTLGGAQILGLAHRTGNFDPGKEADLVVLDPGRHPPLARRLERLDETGASGTERLFALLLGLGRDTVEASYVRGRPVHPDAE